MKMIDILTKVSVFLKTSDYHDIKYFVILKC